LSVMLCDMLNIHWPLFHGLNTVGQKVFPPEVCSTALTFANFIQLKLQKHKAKIFKQVYS
jgi:hypothetical protein